MNTTLARLDQEWTAIARSPSASLALARWGRADPVLGGLASMNEVLELRPDPMRSRAVLGGLARLAPNDPLAARVLLQALLPGLVRVARTAGGGDRDAIDNVIGLAWERLRTYPPHRSGSVALNVILDVRKWYVNSRRPSQPIALEAAAARSAEDVALGRLDFEDLVKATQVGVVDDSTVRIIVRTRIHDEPLEAVAAEVGINVHCLVQRRWRGERRLRDELDPVA